MGLEGRRILQLFREIAPPKTTDGGVKVLVGIGEAAVVLFLEVVFG
jgi:hypothetical protein